MTFTENISKGVNTIANGIFGNLETKEKAQFLMFEIIQMSCQQYQKDEEFRKWITHVGDRNNQNSREYRIKPKEEKK
jgi:hypothetical protein